MIFFFDKEDSPEVSVIKNYSKILSNTYNFNLSANINENVQGPAASPGKEVAIVRSVLSGNTGVDNFLIVGAGSSVVVNDGTIISFDLDNDLTTPNENCYVINADPDNDVVQGLILTSGKIVFDGNVNFYGSLVAIEDIYFNNGKVDLTNNDLEVRKYLAELILVNPNLTDVLDVDTDASVGITMDNYEYIKDVVIGPGSIDSLRQNYNEFIYYQNWRIVE